MIRIIGVILTLNEGKNIKACINSLSFCDRILVLDSGSSDETCKLARSYNAEVIVNKQNHVFNIAKQRNYALDHISKVEENDCWILFLDGDERCTNEFKQNIISSIENENFNSYRCTPKYIFNNHWIKSYQEYPAWHDRLLLLGSNDFDGGVWEHFKNYQNTGYIQTPYIHLAMSKGLDEWLKKHIRYADWDANQTYLTIKGVKENKFKTKRRRILRKLSFIFWPFRPFTRFIYRYIIRLGFMDGINSLLFAFCMIIFDLIYVLKVIFLIFRINKIEKI